MLDNTFRTYQIGDVWSCSTTNMNEYLSLECKVESLAITKKNIMFEMPKNLGNYGG